jgi:signal transduction histidine kinase
MKNGFIFLLWAIFLAGNGCFANPQYSQVLDSLYTGGFHEEGLKLCRELQRHLAPINRYQGQLYEIRIHLRQRTHSEETRIKILSLRDSLAQPKDSLSHYLIGRLYEFEGFYYYLENQPEYAPSLFHKAAHHLSTANSVKALGNLYYLGGAISSGSGFYDKAIDFFLSGISLQETRAEPDSGVWISYLTGMASVYTKLEAPLRGRPYLNKALYMAEKIQDTKQQADLLNNLGNSEALLENPEIALQHYFAALEAYSKLNDIQKQALVKGNIGGIYLNQLADYSKAIQYFEQALQLYKRADNFTGQQTICLAMAKAYSQLDEHFRSDTIALKVHEWAIENRKFSEVLESAKVLVANSLKAKDYQRAHRFQYAISNYRDSINKAQNYEKLQSVERLYRLTQMENQPTKQTKQSASYLLLSKTLSIFKSLGILTLLLALIFGLFYLYFRHDAKKYDYFRQKEIWHSEAMVKGQLFERGRIASDLHDSVGNLMALLRNHTYRFYRTDEALQDIVTQASAEVRAISHDLAADVSRLFSLSDQLLEITENWNRKKNVLIELDNRHFDESIPVQHKTAILRMIQEMLNNAVKSGGADFVLVELVTKSDDTVLLRISDNGRGFNSRTTVSGLGLASIETRVNQMHGFFFVSSEETGTTLEIRLPILT